MMTPKEKAEELIARYTKEIDFIEIDPHTIYELAKTCAIICVKETLKTEYWQAVLAHLKSI